MESWLEVIAHHGATVLDFMALFILAVGSVEAFVTWLPTLFAPRISNHDKRVLWLRFSQCLVAGLTFQLAADIFHTAVAPTWDEIGQLAAIAAIRTFINFFLARDIEEIRERQRDTAASAAPEHASKSPQQI